MSEVYVVCRRLTLEMGMVVMMPIMTMSDEKEANLFAQQMSQDCEQMNECSVFARTQTGFAPTGKRAGYVLGMNGIQEVAFFVVKTPIRESKRVLTPDSGLIM